MMRGYTTIEQSKKLAEILPIESADMFYTSLNRDYPWIWIDKHLMEVDDIPCWSLAALLDVLDYEIVNEDGISYFLNIYKEDNQYQLCYRYELDDIGEYDIWTDSYDDLVDAAFEMIVNLHDLNIL